MPSMTGSRFIAETLHGYGVTAAFFVPGILQQTLVDMESLGVKRVMCHTEKAAGYMADGYARAARRPGVALAQSVGAANLAAGLQDAFLARSPVIALTGRWPAEYRYRHAYQEIDHWPLYEPVTKFNALVDGAAQLPLLLRQAFREAVSGAPGPVHLDLLGIAAELVEEDEVAAEVIVDSSFRSYPAFRPPPDDAQIRAAAELLGQARRPVMLVGGGVTASQAGREITALAERLSMPVVTSLNGKGSIPEDHPLSVGVLGTYSRSCANQVAYEADLVLIVGSQTGGQATHFWQVPKPGVPTIQINIDPVELGRNYPSQVDVLGDARLAVQRLIDFIEPAGEVSDWAQRARRIVADWRAELEPHFQSDASPIRPERLCREVQDILPDDAVLVSDTGHAGIWTGTMIDLTHRTQSYLRCAGSLGWGLPAALGAKCAVPDRPVICFTGDGGIWYHLAELETAVRCNINTVTVINNNRSLNQGKDAIDLLYAGRGDGSPEELWVFEDVDFAKIAESMGCFGVRVTRAGDLRDALAAALAAGRPAVVDVVSDINVVAPLPYVPSQ